MAWDQGSIYCQHHFSSHPLILPTTFPFTAFQRSVAATLNKSHGTRRSLTTADFHNKLPWLLQEVEKKEGGGENKAYTEKMMGGGEQKRWWKEQGILEQAWTVQFLQLLSSPLGGVSIRFMSQVNRADKYFKKKHEENPKQRSSKTKFLISRRSWWRGRRVGMRVWLQCIERRLSRSHLGYCLTTSRPDTRTQTHRGVRTSLTQWWSVRGHCEHSSRWPAESNVHSALWARGSSIVCNVSSAQGAWVLHFISVHSLSSESSSLVEQHIGVTTANLAGWHWRDSGRRIWHIFCWQSIYWKSGIQNQIFNHIKPTLSYLIC